MQLLSIHPDIDLVIFDLASSNMDCSYFHNSFKSEGKYKRLRFLVLSESEEQEDEARCLNFGADEYVKKHTQLQSLKQRVEIQLEAVRREKEFEKEQQNLRLTMESIFHQALIGIAISYSGDPFGEGGEQLLDVNLEYERISGRKKDELINLGWPQITHPDDVEEELQQFRKLERGEISSYSMDKRYIRPDGSIVWAHLIVSALNTGGETGQKHICLVQDITEQKNMVMQIEKAQKLFETFIDSNRDFVFLKDEKLRYIFVNRALAEFYGIGKEGSVATSDFELMDPASAAVCRNSDQKTTDRNNTTVSIEKREDRIFEARKFPVPIAEGKMGVGAYIRDITNEYNQKEIIDKISETNKIITLCMLKPFKNIQEQLDYALHEAIKLTESKYGYIFFYDEAAKKFSINSWSKKALNDCAIDKKQTVYSLDETGLWGEVVRQRKPIIINDFGAANPLKKGYPGGHIEIKKYLSIPIFENNKIVAGVGLANKESDYSENDIYASTVLMSGVWTAARKREKEKETEILLERTQAMINNHEAVMLLIEPKSGQIIEANCAATKFYGYSKEELLHMTIQEINMQSEQEAKKMRFYALHRGQRYFMLRQRLKNGEIRVVDVYASPIEYSDKKVFLSIIFDVTQREGAQKQIEHLVYHDYLTGLYNKRFFDEEFLRRAKKKAPHFPTAVILGDINGFKLFNDSFGHLEGDRTLKEFAEKLQKYCRGENILARVGGDEFGILISKTNEDEIRAYLNELEQKINTGENNALTISFGYGIQRKSKDTMDVLVKEAEAFMYNRKYYSNKSARNNVVNVIMETLFAKSEREKEHSERVGLISEAIAKKMDLDQQMIDKIRVTGFLHDIGKIGIEERILNKIGMLNKTEWGKMKLHPAKGAGILENTLEFRDIADFVLSHHERYDGSGYPNGLKGGEIPLVSRIIAVADAYDAMTNDRSYRAKIEHPEAVAELQRCAGTFFDPEIVAAFVELPLSEMMHLKSRGPLIS